MAKSNSDHKKVVKGTCQGGKNFKTSTLNKSKKRATKPYNRQGR
jgi:hypothetical protein